MTPDGPTRDGTPPDDLTPAEEVLLRRTFALARRARDRGDHPFGAVLTDAAGTVVGEAENTVATSGGDVTGHAETNLVRLLTPRIPAAQRRSHTLFTSCEPCAMCAGAIYWAGIGRVVFGLSEKDLLALTGAHPDNPTLDHPCRLVLAAGQHPVAVSGPHLVDEAADVHRGSWA